MAINATCGLVSLGCSKNLVDSEVMLGLLQEAGLELIPDADRAEVLIVNTCTFLREADEESFAALKEMAARKRRGTCRALVVTGCMVPREAELIRQRVPEVDALLGTGDVTRVVEAVATALSGEFYSSISETTQEYSAALPRVRTTPPWLAYVKIAEGCSHRCTFCVIPSVRGRYRSRPVEDLVRECQRLVAEGVKELVLLAQDSTYYGADLYGEPSLARLLEALTAIPGLPWLRVMYWFPDHLDDRLLSVMAERDNLCSYVDIPFQHADREVLHAMGRPGCGDDYLRLLDRLRDRVPEVALRSAFIVGHPGETEEGFETLLRFVQRARLDHVAAFTYSQEPGTAAAQRSDHLPAAVAQERFDRLLTLQQSVSLEQNRRWLNRSLEVLLEEVLPTGVARGRSYRDAPEVDGCVQIAAADRSAGEFVAVRITGAEPYDLTGEIDPQ